MKRKDLTGKRIGKLTVLGNDPNRHGYVICKCDCGNKTSVRKNSLTKEHPTQSCGCVQREVARNVGISNILKNSRQRLELNAEYDTNFSVIERKAPSVKNTSGHTGVSYDSAHRQYRAYISVHRKTYYLGYFKTYEEAVEVREAAEEKFHRPLIEAKRLATHKEK